MRILQFGRYDYSQVKGGVQFYAESLFQNTPQEIVIDQLVSGNSRVTRVSEIGKRLKVSVASYGVLASVPISPALIWWALRLVRVRKYDLIHLNFPDPLGMLAAALMPRRIPIVVTWHSDIIRQKGLLRFYQPVLKKFMKRVAKVIVATPNHLPSCPQLKELGMDEKIEVIEFGIEPEHFVRTPEREKAAIQIRQKYGSDFLLFAYGRHVYYKGYEYLIRALALTNGCHLILGGSGPLTADLKDLTRELGVVERVSFIGQVPEKMIAPHLFACDLFCFTSVDRTEAFGYTQLEAMMCGRPVLTCELGNGVNYVTLTGQTGLAVEPRNPEALAQAIEKIKMDSELRTRLGANASDRAHQLFDARMTAARTMDLFGHLTQK